MEKLRKAIEERILPKLILSKAKYTKRTGGPGSYKYQYGNGKGQRLPTRKEAEENLRVGRGLPTRKEAQENLKVGRGEKKKTKSSTGKRVVTVREISPGAQQLEIEGKKGKWKCTDKVGGEYHFERINKIGPAKDSRNHLILTAGHNRKITLPDENVQKKKETKADEKLKPGPVTKEDAEKVYQGYLDSKEGRARWDDLQELEVEEGDDIEYITDGISSWLQNQGFEVDDLEDEDFWEELYEMVDAGIR